jgi:hypothetical protein
MNTPKLHNGSLQKRDPACASPSQPPSSVVDREKQNFRAAIQPIVYRARQHGLNRVQIREIMTSLL